MKRPVILVVRKDDRFSIVLRNAGCEVLNLELIRPVPSADLTGLDRILKRLHNYDGLFFTSPVAAEIFAEKSKLRASDFRGRIYVLGERSKAVLESAGFDIVYRGDANTAGDLLASFAETEFRGKRFLYVRGDKSNRTIPDVLGPIASVDEVVVYSTIQVRPDSELLQLVRERLSDRGVDWVCFFSPSAVDSFLALFDSKDLKGPKFAAIGDTTGDRVKDLLTRVDLVSQRATSEEFAAEIIRNIKNSG